MIQEKIQKQAYSVYPEKYEIPSNESYQVVSNIDENKPLRDAYIKGMEDMWDKVEDDIETLYHLKSIIRKEQETQLEELIDFLWMQVDKNGNRMISIKKHFAAAMKKAYSVGQSQNIKI